MAVITRERWRELEPLLDEALSMAPEHQARWLEELRRTDPASAGDIASLLAGEADADAHDFLAEPVGVPLLGMELGAYRLERPLGEGGMGSVWLARRIDGQFEGTAAVKLLNLSLLNARGRERFRREGSVLARLTHPGIARLLDAGVAESGQPYLVLEHVDGQPIDEYVRERNLPLAQRLALFARVLEAVSHAHTNLVVHSDLKPSNILVTTGGTPKLLDFGIAKLLDAGEHDGRPPITIDGVRGLTPEFAAPEQLHGGAVTTATDVYALGVLAYLLISGRHPTATGCCTTAETLLALLAVEPARLGVGDLDNVLARALCKEPAGRYQSVAALADDIDRFLHFQPVRAKPNSLAYRAGRFVRRNRAAVAAGVAVLLLTVGYVANVMVDRGRVRRALDAATLSARKAERVSAFAVGLFETAGGDEAFADSVTAGALLHNGLVEARELAAQPEIEAQMLDVIGRSYGALGNYDSARTVLREALDIRSARLDSLHPDVASSLVSLAHVLVRSDAVQDAVPLYARALNILRTQFGDSDERTSEALWGLASAQHIAGDRLVARKLLDEWIALASRQPIRQTPRRAGELWLLASNLYYSGQQERAVSLARRSLDIYRSLYGDSHARVATQMIQLAGILDEPEQRNEADSLFRDAIATLRSRRPDGHPELANALRDEGFHLLQSGRPAAAEPDLREATELYRRFLGDETIPVANVKVGHARSLIQLGRHAEARRVLETCLPCVSREPRMKLIVGRSQLALGAALRGEGRVREAESVLLANLELVSGTSPFSADIRELTAAELASLYQSMNRPVDAARFRALADSARKQSPASGG